MLPYKHEVAVFPGALCQKNRFYVRLTVLINTPALTPGLHLISNSREGPFIDYEWHLCYVANNTGTGVYRIQEKESFLIVLIQENADGRKRCSYLTKLVLTANAP